MKKETKGTLVGSALLLSMLIGIFSVAYGLASYDNRSKFQEGDCVAQVYENEFKKSVYYHKILKVGKKMYLTKYKPEDSDGFVYMIEPNTELKFSLNKYETVDKSLCVAKTHK